MSLSLKHSLRSFTVIMVAGFLAIFCRRITPSSKVILRLGASDMLSIPSSGYWSDIPVVLTTGWWSQSTSICPDMTGLYHLDQQGLLVSEGIRGSQWPLLGILVDVSAGRGQYHQSCLGVSLWFCFFADMNILLFPSLLVTTGDISIDSLWHIVFIQLLTSHKPGSLVPTHETLSLEI